LRKQSHKQRRQFPLTRFVRDEVLANFKCHVVQVPLLAMDGDRIIRRVGDAIRFVVAEDETFLTMQELHQDVGETRVAAIEHADMTEPPHGLENGCEAVHGNQGCWAGGFSSPIELGRDAIVIGPEYLPNARELVRQMTFILVGAGPTGVELAGSLAHMVKVTLRGNFRRIDPAKASIILLDGAKRVLPTFAEPVSRKVARRLEKLGVKVMTDVKVETVDDEGVIAGGSRIPGATVLWTAGVAASPIPKMLGTKTDRAGRALVDPFLKVVDAPGVFVVGDAASVMQNEHPVPGVAQAAIQEGRYVGRLIAKELKGREVKRPFRYFDKGNMAVVGKNYAVLERGSLRTGGFLTWLVWAFVHVLSLPQLQNRLRVQHQWLWSYFTGQRSSRLIPEPPWTPGTEAR
jgi:Pyridine nucleotide-disulphide oxidoreductase